MSLNINATDQHCSFCIHNNQHSRLLKGMHGLYCEFEHCYTRQSHGNVAPPIACKQCAQNSFYFEVHNHEISSYYKCICCGYVEHV